MAWVGPGRPQVCACTFLPTFPPVCCVKLSSETNKTLWGIVLSEEDEDEEASNAGPPNTTEEETSGADDDAVKQSSETESAGLMI